MDVLETATKLTGQILSMTRAMVFTGDADKDEQEVEAYENLINSREPLVQELLKLNIDESAKSMPAYRPIKQTIIDIAELDRKHLAFMGEMHETIKDAYKQVKHGQRIHKGYTSLPPEAVSVRFDKKQ